MADPSNESNRTLIDLQRRAVIAANAGKYDDSVKLCTNELSLLLSEEKEAEAGAVYIDLAEIDHLRGRFPSAEVQYEKGIRLLKRYGVSNDPRLVGALDGLGWLYVTWGRRGKGSRIMEQARAMADQADLTPEQRIKHLDAQAAYYVVRTRYSQAQQQWSQALQIGKSQLTGNPSQYDYVLLHSGQASALYRDYATATKRFHEFLQVDPRRTGTNAISHAVAEGELAHVYVRTHKLNEARTWFDESLDTFRGRIQQAPLIYSMILSYFGDYYMAKKDWADAELEYRQALNIRQKVVGNSHAAARTMLALSKALEKLHLKHEAKQMVARAKVILVAEKDPSQDQTVDVLALKHE